MKTNRQLTNFEKSEDSVNTIRVMRKPATQANLKEHFRIFSELETAVEVKCVRLHTIEETSKTMLIFSIKIAKFTKIILMDSTIHI